jgi:diguanylate cyclase (GGDEF)-like protein
VQAYLDLSIQENQEHLRQLTIRMALLLAGILIVAFLMLLWLERWYFRSTSRTWKTQTHVDPLTGVANRRAGIELLEDAFRRSKDSPDSPCLMMMDIDDFKHVNDTHGHPVGDEVLKTLTRRINENIRSTDTLCRWGGEEFMLFCEHLPRDRSLSLAEKLLEAVRAETFGSPDDPWRVTISIGISCTARRTGRPKRPSSGRTRPCIRPSMPARIKPSCWHPTKPEKPAASRLPERPTASRLTFHAGAMQAQAGAGTFIPSRPAQQRAVPPPGRCRTPTGYSIPGFRLQFVP